MKINPREKRRHAEGREKNVSPFVAWVDFHARFARSTIPEEKWGLLVVYACCAKKVYSSNYMYSGSGFFFLKRDCQFNKTENDSISRTID